MSFFLPISISLTINRLFTDYHCVPPNTIRYNHRGEKVVYDFVSIHARTERAPDAAKYNEAGTLSLQLVTRTNDIPNPHPIYDPINKQVHTLFYFFYKSKHKYTNTNTGMDERTW